ncbi:hypothetical protein [Candidatus Enterococcus ferrettii]|uniref:Uncharacterized protein n=1 Tax=Candidatus Enterococcus ferrettii TaxID=2815324 RepID=A0ABV0ER16_9ENTE|nr:hypothetical protein [Enterococcus sp. 665A]MBO1339098.1 hypothetical protein [Enterococcus sp. 665A]
MKLGYRQLMTMKPAGLAQRFWDFFAENDESAYLIQCALLVQIRNSLSPTDFSFLAKELICQLFLEGSDLQEVKELCVYFRPYFTDNEWQKVTTRLFPTPKERAKITEQARLYTKKFPLLYSGEREVQTKASLLATFMDENGKKHSWTTSNVDPNLTSQQHEEYLSLLSTLTILQKDGVRRFVSLVEVNYSLFRTSIARRTQEEIDEHQAKVNDLPRVNTIGQAVAQPEEQAPADNMQELSESSKKVAQAAKTGTAKQRENQTSQKIQKQLPQNKPVLPEADSSEELNDPESVAAYLNQLKRKAAGNPPTREERKKQNQINKALGKKKRRRK